MAGGLVYVNDDEPGITRRPLRHGWAYFGPDGARITDRTEIDRLNAIALPPAYTDAWFCPYPNGHLIARGIDAKGRRQYRYHPDFRAAADAQKYDRCCQFGAALPALRKRVLHDLGQQGLGRDKVTAAVVRLLDRSAIRVGNECYVRANRSYGATTLRQRHAEVKGTTLKIAFRAKSGKERQLALSDAVLARIVRKLSDLPGQHLFQYVDGTDRCPVSSTDVNGYIQQAMGGPFSAKDFRTFAGSVRAFEALASARGKVGMRELAETVAEFLGNTPTIAKASYIHPALLELARDGQEQWRGDLRLPRRTTYLDRYERGMIAHICEGVGR